MNRHTVLARISLLLASILGSINVASGSWLITDGEPGKVTASEKISSDSTKAVCYIKETGVYYTSLDRALEVAEKERPNEADTICVIPNLKKADGTTSPVEIKDSHTILSDDSLVLPYDYNGALIACGYNIETEKEINDKAAINGAKDVIFADQDAQSVSKYRQTKVVLNAGVQLTVKGSLLIGGKLGRQTQGVSGSTAGSYCEIVLSDNAGIVCSGAKANIECDGYIKRAAKDNGSSLQVAEGGTLLSPLVIYDYKGGNYTMNIAGSQTDISPFYVFDFPNIQVETQVMCGAYWVSKTYFYIESMSYFVPAKNLYFIASSESSVNPILIQKSDSIITVDYIPADTSNTYTSSGVDGTKTNITVSGNVDIGSINATISGMPVDSTTFYLPISYRLNMFVKTDSILNSPNKIKFMNGSSVTIERGATVNVTAPMAIYGSDFVDNASGISNSYRYPSIKKNGKAVGASFVNNGTIKVSGEGVISGRIDTDESGAYLDYATENYSIDSPEIGVWTDSNSSVTMTTYSQSAPTGLIIDSGGSSFTEKNLNNNYYQSVSDTDNTDYGWSVYPLTISNVTIEKVDGSEEQDTNAGSVQVKATPDPKYMGNFDYTWSIVNNTDETNIVVVGNGSTATILNKTATATNVTVMVTAGNSSGSSSASISLDVAGKLGVDIEKGSYTKDGEYGYTTFTASIDRSVTENPSFAWELVDGTDTGVSISDNKTGPSITIRNSSAVTKKAIIKVKEESSKEEAVETFEVEGREWKISSVSFDVTTNPAGFDFKNGDENEFEAPDADISDKDGSSTKPYLYYSKTEYDQKAKYNLSLKINDEEKFDTSNATFWWKIVPNKVTGSKISYTNFDNAEQDCSDSGVTISTNKPSISIVIDSGVRTYTSGNKEKTNKYNTMYVTVSFCAEYSDGTENSSQFWQPLFATSTKQSSVTYNKSTGNYTWKNPTTFKFYVCTKTQSDSKE